MDEYIAELGKIYAVEHQGFTSVVYTSAGIFADAIRDEIQNAPPSANLKAWEKQELLDCIGIAHMQIDDGQLNVKVGFANGMYRYTYRAGLGVRAPAVVIARSVAKGTSFRRRFPFIQRAVKKAKQRAFEESKDIFEKTIEEAK